MPLLVSLKATGFPFSFDVDCELVDALDRGGARTLTDLEEMTVEEWKIALTDWNPTASLHKRAFNRLSRMLSQSSKRFTDISEELEAFVKTYIEDAAPREEE